jgi:hypothetical protein
MFTEVIYLLSDGDVKLGEGSQKLVKFLFLIL